MHLMLMDQKGKFAVVDMAEVNYNVLRASAGVRLVETGEVLKDPGTDFPTEAPAASIIEAHTKYGYDLKGPCAIRWSIGHRAPNGFSIPTQEVINACYIRCE